MKLLAIILTVILYLSPLFGKEISVEDAQKVATSFFQTKSSIKQKQSSAQALTLKSKAQVKSGLTTYYAFNKGSENGFVLIAGDDRVNPILGYSFEGSFDTSTMAPQTKAWLALYEKSIIEIDTKNYTASSKTTTQWAELLVDTDPNLSEIVSPLLKTKWGQGNYYNELCPYDSTTNARTPVGCVATAMAQIMKYWGYPTNGKSWNKYVPASSPQYGALSANFETTIYNWSSMSTSLTSSNDAVASLMYHCGVSVDMDYSPDGSSALVAGSLPNTAQKALINYFRYAPSIESKSKGCFSEDNWILLLKTELSAGRPILYNAQDINAGGHAFVVDGYDSNNYFHVNWGWNGVADGYFLIGSLNPQTYEFNVGQSALINIMPLSNELNLNSTLITQSDIVELNKSFAISTSAKNIGNSTFTGTLCVKILGADSIPLASSETVKLSLKASKTTDTLTFGDIKINLPGKYLAKLFYKKKDGQWLPLSNGTLKNLAEIKVLKKDSIKLASEIKVQRTSIISGEPLSVAFSLTNVGITEFNHPVRMALYNSESVLKNAIYADSLSSIATGEIKEYSFHTASVTLCDGTYKIAAEYYSGTEWTQTGGELFLNGKDISIETAVNDDAYENNNTIALAYSIADTLTTIKATTKATDKDYYKIVFQGETNSLYLLSLKTNEAKTNANVVFAWATDTSSWTKPINETSSENISVKNGDVLYVRVLPSSENEAGAYSFTWAVESQFSVEKNVSANPIIEGIYPNPAENFITISSTLAERLTRWAILNQSGQKLLGGETQENTFDISRLKSGVYILSAQTANGFCQQKFIKN